MIAGLRRFRNQRLRRVLCWVGMIFLACAAAQGQQSEQSQELEQLQQKLQQLQQQYEATTQGLEQRLTTLRQQMEQEKVAREQQVEKETEDINQTKQTTVSTAAAVERTVRSAGRRLDRHRVQTITRWIGQRRVVVAAVQNHPVAESGPSTGIDEVLKTRNCGSRICIDRNCSR
jgi:DNA anti-recombination protein RmuC